MITFEIDELTPCLKEISTGDIYNSKSPIPPMDLRGYADYVREHGLESATEETVKMFIISPSE